MDPRATAIVPAYGLTSKEVADTLRALPRSINEVVIVYNDECEPDLSAEYKELEPAITSIRVPYRVGKVDAMRLGLSEAVRLSPGRPVVQIDGDLKQPPVQAAMLLDKVAAGGDLAVANRYAFQDLALQEHRQAVSYTMATLCRAVTGYRLTDAVCGLRAYSARLASLFAERLCSAGYGLEMEQLVLASSTAAKVVEVPIESNRQADGTIVEKLEENLLVLLWYSRSLAATKVQLELARLVMRVKDRTSFTLNLGPFGESRMVGWCYHATAHGLTDLYSLRVCE